LSETKILLGFEVPSGEPVTLPLHHLAIFGMTQLSGKTTTLEALISRSGLKAIAFITKRGESGFSKVNIVTPYYKPRSDWQYVEGLVNVALGERVKYEPGIRYAIIKACKTRKTLEEIHDYAVSQAVESRGEFMRSVWEKLAVYLEIVIPELRRHVFTEILSLQEGVNVMDLSGMRLETQQLVIASTIEYALTKLDHIVAIVPEAWEMLPQGKMTPVKWVAAQFIRKGAAIGNYLWLDSQDIGGIDKTPLRQCDNWIMGRMKEAHEVERILKQLLGVKVAAEEIQTLPLGHFYAAIGNEVRKVYVLPAGVPEAVGVEVARGVRTPESIRDEFLKVKIMDDEKVWKEKYEQLEKEFADIRKKIYEELRTEFDKQAESLKKLGRQELEEEFRNYQDTIKSLTETIRRFEEENKRLQEDLKTADELKFSKDDEIAQLTKELEGFRELKSALGKILPTTRVQIPPEPEGPSEISVSMEQPVLHVKRERPPLTLSQDDLQGRIAIVYAEGLLPEKAFSTRQLNKVMERRFGHKEAYANFERVLTDFVAWNFFEKIQAGSRWDYRVKLKPEEAKAKGLLKVEE